MARVQSHKKEGKTGVTDFRVWGAKTPGKEVNKKERRERNRDRERERERTAKTWSGDQRSN